MKIKILLVFIVLTKSLFSQNVPQVITGKVYSDSVLVKNIHIINKNTNYGTISNHKGTFKIPIKINDTLQFSGIQFYIKNVIITENHIKNKKMDVQLIPKMNLLKTVELKSNPFSGNLVTDVRKIKTSIFVTEGVLDFSNYNLEPKVFGYGENNKAEPAAAKLTNPHIPIGLTLLQVKLGKPFKKKEAPIQQQIRNEFGDEFFIKTLNIPLIHIDLFLNQCKNKGITRLYKNDKKLELIDVFIKESKNYLKELKNED